ncbi:hypothetical protein J8273_4184 [Carpediemonas membranifera]|uniref:Uncharacterized protein n=1 Tax=Carpediemonas membranifera TaxID=201153 RepID=A0A8J6EAC6_9EUKA|nr:hypothetical protein J8273_4184 [Carpediemonas membranifera]|eukprot:KAG9394510.1 hypothetical protein J8273_4184 [Carpediemonas membranifera]
MQPLRVLVTDYSDQFRKYGVPRFRRRFDKLGWRPTEEDTEQGMKMAFEFVDDKDINRKYTVEMDIVNVADSDDLYSLDTNSYTNFIFIDYVAHDGISTDNSVHRLTSIGNAIFSSSKNRERIQEERLKASRSLHPNLIVTLYAWDVMDREINAKRRELLRGVRDQLFAKHSQIRELEIGSIEERRYFSTIDRDSEVDATIDNIRYALRGAADISAKLAAVAPTRSTWRRPETPQTYTPPPTVPVSGRNRAEKLISTLATGQGQSHEPAAVRVDLTPAGSKPATRARSHTASSIPAARTPQQVRQKLAVAESVEQRGQPMMASEVTSFVVDINLPDGRKHHQVVNESDCAFDVAAEIQRMYGLTPKHLEAMTHFVQASLDQHFKQKQIWRTEQRKQKLQERLKNSKAPVLATQGRADRKELYEVIFTNLGPQNREDHVTVHEGDDIDTLTTNLITRWSLSHADFNKIKYLFNVAKSEYLSRKAKKQHAQQRAALYGAAESRVALADLV